MTLDALVWRFFCGLLCRKLPAFQKQATCDFYVVRENAANLRQRMVVFKLKQYSCLILTVSEATFLCDVLGAIFALGKNESSQTILGASCLGRGGRG
jgi:hypothetical protein